MKHVIIPPHPNPIMESYYDACRRKYLYEDGVFYNYLKGEELLTNHPKKLVFFNVSGVKRSVKYDVLKMLQEHPEKTPKDYYIGSNYILRDGEWIWKPEPVVRRVVKQIKITKGPHCVGKIVDKHRDIRRIFPFLKKPDIQKCLNEKKEVKTVRLMYITPKQKYKSKYKSLEDSNTKLHMVKQAVKKFRCNFKMLYKPKNI